MAYCDNSLLIVGILFVAIHSAIALECYFCKSGRDGPCGLFTASTGVAVQKCSDANDVCLQIDYNVNATEGFPQFVDRRCAASDTLACPPPPDKGYVYCSVCGTNLCNNDPTSLKSAEHVGVDNNNNKQDRGAGSGSAALQTFLTGIVALFLL